MKTNSKENYAILINYHILFSRTEVDLKTVNINRFLLIG